MVPPNETVGKISRRRAMKLGAGTTSGLISLSSVGAARPSGEVAGISYDTLTHFTGNPVRGNITVEENSLRGTLHIAGFQIPLERLNAIETKGRGTRFRAFLDDETYLRGKIPLKVELTVYNDHFSGVLTRPSGEYGKLGFVLDDPDKIDVQKMTAMKKPDPRWVNNPHSFEVPQQGVPTDSGIKRLIEILPKPVRAKGGED